MTCDEVFYGLLRPGDIHADYSVPRVCELPTGHKGSHDWDWPSRVCPDEATHTTPPRRFYERRAFVRTHRNLMCPTCHLFVIWEPA